MADNIDSIRQTGATNIDSPISKTGENAEGGQTNKEKKEARKKEIQENFNNFTTRSFSVHKDVNEQIKELMDKQNKNKPNEVIIESAVYKGDLKKELEGLSKTSQWQFLNFTQEDEPLLQSFFESLAWDIKQTSSWADLGVSEINPLLQPYTKGQGNNPMIPTIMLAESAASLGIIGSIKDKTLRNILLTALVLGEGYLVTQNGWFYPAQHDRFGPPRPGQTAPGVFFRMHLKF